MSPVGELVRPGVSAMSPKRGAKYEVYVQLRGKRPKATGEVLELDTIPSTWESASKEFHFCALDDVLGLIVFSEADPRMGSA
jgi:hypothetical protein